MPGQALPCEEGPARRPGLYSQKTLRQRRRNWKQVLWKTKKKKRKSLESVSKVVMVENKKNMAENWLDHPQSK